jgi:hypothetical protein
MTARPLILGIAGLAGLGLVLALRGRERATADLPQHPYPGEGDDGLPPVDAGLFVCDTGDELPNWGPRLARCDWRATWEDPSHPWCVTHSSYHDGRQA